MKLKLRDKDIRFLYFFFATMMIISLFAVCYAGLFQNVAKLNLSAFYTFLFFTLFTRYFYAIQYAIEKIERINQRERQHQLDLEARNKKIG